MLKITLGVTGKTYPMGIEQFLLERERKIGEKKGIEKGIEKSNPQWV
jgi:hypothetical protein